MCISKEGRWLSAADTQQLLSSRTTGEALAFTAETPEDMQAARPRRGFAPYPSPHHHKETKW